MIPTVLYKVYILNNEYPQNKIYWRYRHKILEIFKVVSLNINTFLQASFPCCVYFLYVSNRNIFQSLRANHINRVLTLPRKALLTVCSSGTNSEWTTSFLSKIQSALLWFWTLTCKPSFNTVIAKCVIRKARHFCFRIILENTTFIPNNA